MYFFSPNVFVVLYVVFVYASAQIADRSELNMAPALAI